MLEDPDGVDRERENEESLTGIIYPLASFQVKGLAAFLSSISRRVVDLNQRDRVCLIQPKGISGIHHRQCRTSPKIVFNINTIKVYTCG